MGQDKQCSAYIDHGGGIGSYCVKKPTTKVNDKYYCTYHHPDKVRARDAKRQSFYNANREAWQKRHDRDIMILGIFGGIDEEVIKANIEAIKKAIKLALGGKG